MSDNYLRESAEGVYWTKRDLKGPVVRYYLAQPSHSRPPETAFSSAQMITALKRGLEVAELEELRAALDIPMDQLVVLLGLSRATWQRRKLAGRLDAAESDRVVRYARLVGTATEVLESLENARAWLKAPQFGLGGAVPLEYADTELGAREVEDLLGRIDYGVYS